MASRPQIEFSLTPGFCILSALMLLVLPLRWITASVLAAAIHESCHCIALYLCGIRIYGLTIGSGGAVLKTAPMSLFAELFCALAGPAGSLLLLLLLRQAPVLALCGGIQGLFNLLPIYPFDGGRALGCLLRLICPRHAAFIAKLIRSVMFLLLIVGSFWFSCALNPGADLLIPIFFLLFRLLHGKTPCKAP